MSTKKSWVLGSLLVGGLSIAATAPVAMRVEVEPMRQVGAATEVAVVVQVSPEDRAPDRIKRHPSDRAEWRQGELGEPDAGGAARG